MISHIILRIIVLFFFLQKDKPFCTMTVNDKGVQARGCVTDFIHEKGEANGKLIN
jgi:hypothetical protein